MARQFDLPGRSPLFASSHAVATSHPLATTTALCVLNEGGNAIDAALAASATLCVVEPHMTGIGGDCFAIVAEPDGKLHGLNGSGRSAKNAELEWYLEQGFSEIQVASPHAVTVPGAIKAWEALHHKFGQMDFARLLYDAVRYAEEGFVVAPRVASDWKGLEGKLNGHVAASANLLKGGKAPNVGETMQFPLLAKTLRRIASEGSKAFYQGEIAQEIAGTVQSLGGFLSEEDLSNASADWITPISTEYNGHMLHELPPNGQGLAALVLTNLLREIGTTKEADDPHRAHLEMECGRIAYAVRDAHIADPDHMKLDVDAMLSKAATQKLTDLYDPNAKNKRIALPDMTGSDTVYLSVVDRDGMAVSFINSVFSGFGSGIMTPKSGIVLQNRGSGFSLIPGHANAIGSAKRPFHTIIPAMVTNQNKVTHCYGVMGGSYQAMGHAHVLSNMLDFDMDPQAALDDPRIFWNAEGELELETGVSAETEALLKAKGHRCIRTGVHGGGQIIQINHKTGTLIAGSDPRKDGCAAGV